LIGVFEHFGKQGDFFLDDFNFLLAVQMRVVFRFLAIELEQGRYG
jgi:hypothetical protein